MKKILGLVGVALLVAGPAFAADMAVKAPVRPMAAPAYNWTGCYVGGFVGGAGGSNVSASEAASQGGRFPAGTFYNAPAGASYSYRTDASFIGGGTLGCNWQVPGSAFVLGLEGEIGYIHSSATVLDPNSVTTGVRDTFDSTTVGDWYGVIGPRVGLAAGPALFYAKGGAAFTRVSSSVIDSCTTGTCGGGTLNATGSNTNVGWAVGGGVEYWIAPQWTIKGEYLFLGGINQNYSVCGAGGGTAAGSTFCSNHSAGGISTGKLGLNFHF